MPFVITMHKGFHLTLANGVSISVQFGPGNYCEHHMNCGDFMAPAKAERWESELAEIAIWPSKDGEMVQLRNDTVEGWVTADLVAELLGTLRILPAGVPAKVVSEVARLILTRREVPEDEFKTRMEVTLEVAGLPKEAIKRNMAYWNPIIIKGKGGN